MDNKPVDAFKTFSWVGKHSSPKKVNQSKINLEKARKVRKSMQAQGKIVGGWPKNKPRGKRVPK